MSSIQGLDHIGIAVRSLDEGIARYVDVFGLTFDGIEEVPTEKVRVAMLRAGDTRIELLEATDASSPVAKFIEKRGPGVHHLAFRVSNTGEMIKVLTDAGAPVIGDAPRPGAHGTEVAFVHPKFLDGVLAELVQHPERRQSDQNQSDVTK